MISVSASPQWSRPEMGRMTSKHNPPGLIRDLPQWSRPPDGRTT
jgi:hypothetical protein